MNIYDLMAKHGLSAQTAGSPSPQPESGGTSLYDLMAKHGLTTQTQQTETTQTLADADRAQIGRLGAEIDSLTPKLDAQARQNAQMASFGGTTVALGDEQQKRDAEVYASGVQKQDYLAQTIRQKEQERAAAQQREGWRDYITKADAVLQSGRVRDVDNMTGNELEAEAKKTADTLTQTLKNRADKMDAAARSAAPPEIPGVTTFGGTTVAVGDEEQKQDLAQYGADRTAEALRKMAKYAGKTYEDTFGGQFDVNRVVGRLTQDQSLAWNAYLDSPTDANRKYAEALGQLTELVQANNVKSLDDVDTVIPLLSKEFAAYVPQLVDQTKESVKAAAVMAAPALAAGPAALAGAVQAGITAGSGAYSFKTMRGAAFQNLINMGVDEETASKAANDEALISSLIEMADTGLDIAALGGGKLLNTVFKTPVAGTAKAAVENWVESDAVRKVAAMLLKYGVNILQEGEEEATQEAVSIANERLAKQGKTGLGELLKGATQTYLNPNEEEAERMGGSRTGGRHLGALTGGAQMFGTNIASDVIGRLNGMKEARALSAETANVQNAQNVTAAENAPQIGTDAASQNVRRDNLSEALLREITAKDVEKQDFVDTQTQPAYTETTNENGGVNNGRAENGAGSVGDAVPGVPGQERPVLANREDVAGERDNGAGGSGNAGELRLTEDTEDGNRSYSEALAAAKASDTRNGWAVTQKSPEELAGMKKRLSADGTVGYAVTQDGDLEAVFKNRSNKTRNVMRDVLPQAIADGATKGDCYGDRLMNIYEAAGAIPVARVTFNDVYANEGWDESKGRPYTYVFMFSGDDADTVRSKTGQYHISTPEELNNLPTFGPEGYDDALAYRDMLLANRQAAAQTQQTAAPMQQNVQADESTGAAPEGFDPWTAAEIRYGTMDKNYQTANPADAPVSTDGTNRVSQTVSSALGAEVTDERMHTLIRNATLGGTVNGLTYMPMHNDDIMYSALQDIQSAGWTQTYSDWSADVARGVVSSRNTAIGIWLYNNAVQAGDYDMAMDVLGKFAMMGREDAVAMELRRVLQNMTPSSRLYMIQKSIDTLNKENEQQKNTAKKGSAAEQRETQKRRKKGQERRKQVEGTAEKAVRKAVQKVADKYSGQTFTFEYSDAVGTAVAKILMPKADARSRTFLEQMVSDISRLARQNQEQKQRAATGTSATTDYLLNREFYEESFQKAKEEIMRQYAERGEEIPADVQTVLNSALFGEIRADDILKDIGTKIREVARGGVKAQNGVIESVQTMLTDKYGMDDEDASAIAEELRGKIAKAAREEAQKELASMFGEKEARSKRALTFYENIEMLSNLGAFSQEEYADAATKYAFGTDEGITISQELIDEFLSAQTETERDSALEKMEQYVADQIPPTLADKWNGIRYLNMLGNLRTQARNVSGNTVMGIVSTARYELAALMEKALPADQRTKTLTLDPELLKAAMADAKLVEKELLGDGRIDLNEARKSGASAFMREVYDKRKIFSVTRKGAEYGSKTAQALANFAENYKNATDFLMDKGDVFFSSRSYARELSGYLKAKGVTAEQFADAQWQADNAGLVDAARSYAIRQAQEDTFRDNNAFSDWVVKIGRRPDSPAWAKAMANGVLPFRKTPADVLVRAYEYSPAGLFFETIRQVEKTKRGKATGADIINAIAKGTTGTILMTAGMFLGAAGILRGKEADDEQEYFDQLNGQQDYSIVIGDKSFTIDWAAPAVLPLFVGAEFGKAAKEGGVDLNDLSSALATFTEPMLQLSMLQGVNDLYEKIQNNRDMKGLELGMDIAVSYAAQGVANTLFGQIERTIEKNRMATYVDKNKPIPPWLQKEVGKLSAKLPFDIGQYEYIDAWGRKESNGSLAGRALENFLSPSYVDTVSEDKVSREIQRLHDATGSPSVFPDVSAKSFNVNGKTKKLTKDEYVKYATTKGQTQRKIVSDLFDSDEYADMTDEQKLECVGMAYEFANAKGKMACSDYQVPKTGSWLKAAFESGADPAEYIIDYELGRNERKMSVEQKVAKQTGLEYVLAEDLEKYNENGYGFSQAEAYDYIQSRKNIPDAEKQLIWEACGGGKWKSSYADYAAKQSKE